jgi:hypothetical protein
MVASALVAVWRASFGDFFGKQPSDRIDHFVEFPCTRSIFTSPFFPEWAKLSKERPGRAVLVMEVP